MAKNKKASADEVKTEEIKDKDSIEDSVEDITSDEREPVSEQENVSSVEDRVKELETALAEEKNKNLRAFADMENYKKRIEQDTASFKKYAGEKIVLAFLPITDSFQRAKELMMASENVEKEITEGIELIEKQLKTALEKSGVSAIDAIDKPFDPNFHQAVLQEEAEEKEPNLVIKELEKGYMIHDRVLRPSMVVVSK